MGNTAGKLRIGNDWHAISILALSQTNPLKALAEFVENSIDAHSRTVTIVRSKERGEVTIRIIDDGDGMPKDEHGDPNFKFVATHLCDSLKKRLKDQGKGNGIQGEFGIGLLGFWTLGEQLSMSCAGKDQKVHTMQMRRGEELYSVTARKSLAIKPGTEVALSGLLPGPKQITGERIQSFLASELGERIRISNVAISVVDKIARQSFAVEPRRYAGRQLVEIRGCVKEAQSIVPISVELYLAAHGDPPGIALHRRGTRVFDRVTQVDGLSEDPWGTDLVVGFVDCPAINLSPGSRLGVIQDAPFALFLEAMEKIGSELTALLEAQQRLEDERASADVLRSIRRALKETLSALPENYLQWIPYQERRRGGREAAPDITSVETADQTVEGLPVETPSSDAVVDSPDEEAAIQSAFFEIAGPLHSVQVSPRSLVLSVGKEHAFRAICRDKSRRTIDRALAVQWTCTQGVGSFDDPNSPTPIFRVPQEPGLNEISVEVREGETVCRATALITVTDTLEDLTGSATSSKSGIPGYTFLHEPGSDWRSRYDSGRNIVTVNSGHRDFVYAARSKQGKTRYICRLFLKELCLVSFQGESHEVMLERLIQLMGYAEEYLR